MHIRIVLVGCVFFPAVHGVTERVRPYSSVVFLWVCIGFVRLLHDGFWFGCAILGRVGALSLFRFVMLCCVVLARSGRPRRVFLRFRGAQFVGQLLCLFI